MDVTSVECSGRSPYFNSSTNGKLPYARLDRDAMSNLELARQKFEMRFCRIAGRSIDDANSVWGTHLCSRGEKKYLGHPLPRP